MRLAIGISRSFRWPCPKVATGARSRQGRAGCPETIGIAPGKPSRGDGSEPRRARRRRNRPPACHRQRAMTGPTSAQSRLKGVLVDRDEIGERCAACSDLHLRAAEAADTHERHSTPLLSGAESSVSSGPVEGGRRRDNAWSLAEERGHGGCVERSHRFARKPRPFRRPPARDPPSERSVRADRSIRGSLRRKSPRAFRGEVRPAGRRPRRVRRPHGAGQTASRSPAVAPITSARFAALTPATR